MSESLTFGDTGDIPKLNMTRILKYLRFVVYKVGLIFLKVHAEVPRLDQSTSCVYQGVPSACGSGSDRLRDSDIASLWTFVTLWFIM